MGLFRRRNLSGARVFITGAASGIGKATAQAVAAKGGELFLTDVNAAALEKALAEDPAAVAKVLAGVTSLGDRDVRLIIREVYQDPRNYGKVSFPTAAKSTDLRPYTKGTLVREDEELEEDLEDDIEDEEIENLDRVLPPEETTDEAFVEETDELDES